MNKAFVKDFFSLSIIQVANYLFPMITIPYVVRIIGPANLGIINLAQAVIAYLILVVNFGFDFTATREISIHRNDRKMVGKLFSATFFAKFLLFLITVIIFIFITHLKSYRGYSAVFFYTYISVFANVLFPTWYFQGTGQLTKISAVNFFTRLLILILTFVFIKKITDYPLVPLVTSGGQLILNFGSMIYAVKKNDIDFHLPGFSAIYQACREGLMIFFSSLATNVYLTGSVIILGFYAAPDSVGFFTASSKLFAIFQSIILFPIYQTLFPHLSKSFDENRENGLRILRKMLVIVVFVTALGSVFMLVFAKLIILLIYGAKFVNSILCLKIIAFLPLITGISNVMGVQGLVNLKKDKIFLGINVAGAIISIIANMLLANAFQHIGTSIAWVISETGITIGFILVYRRLKINLFDWAELKRLTHPGYFLSGK